MWVGALIVEAVENLPITIVEVGTFVADADRLFSEQELADLKMMLAAHPEKGQVIAGSGGLRKVRYGLGNRGKSRGARVVYYYRNRSRPLFLLAVYAKSEKTTLSDAERNEFRQLVTVLDQQYEPNRENVYRLPRR